MKRKIYLNLFIFSLAATVLTSLLLSAAVYRKNYDNMKTELRKETAFLSEAVNSGGIAVLDNIGTETGDTRITYIRADGTVLFDTDEDPLKMENHLNRPEVVEALETGSGQSARYSGTLGMNTYYSAVKLQNGDVLRAAFTVSGVFDAVLSLVPYIFLIAFVLSMLSLLIAKKQTERIISPLNALDLEHPLENNVYAEFSPLLLRLEKQGREIERRIDELTRLQNKFKTITDDMKEGLVVIGSDGIILSINKSAKNIFKTESDDTEGRHFLVLNRSIAYMNTVEAALGGKAAESQLLLNARTYQLMASAAAENEDSCSAVLLILDITEKALSDQMRREFSANVSHELKTPLTSILGSADIIRNKIAKPEDIPLFAERICEDSERLMTLIDDIIKLSRLDESADNFPRENVDFFALCCDVVKNMREYAEKRGVELTISGEKCVISGVPRLLTDIVYNLCDNAVKYNREGGNVRVIVEKKGESAVLTVADTGIGIPAEDQSRIFERFYRVDKSRSNETRGTGLGLSIVKYAAKIHNADIDLKSRENIGTTVTVTFPVK